MIRKLNSEQEQDIIKRYLACISPLILAKEYGVGHALIYQTLKRHGIKSDRFSLFSYIDIEKQKEICDKYKSGHSSIKLAVEYDTTDSSITKILRHWGIEVRTRDIARKKFFPNRDYFEKINTPAKAYILGLLLSDGNVWGNKITLSLQTSDKYLLEFILDEIFKGAKPTIYKTANANSNSIVITDKKITHDLKKFSMVERKSLILKYPTGLSKRVFGHFLRGFFDGDGCIYYNKKRAHAFIITGGSFGFLELFRKEIIKNLIKNYDKDLLKVYCHPRGWFDIRTSRRGILKKIFNLMYGQKQEMGKFYMARKYEKFHRVVKDIG